MNFLSLDIGTTCCKGQLFSEEGEILAYHAEEYELLSQDGESYVDIEAIGRHIKAIIRCIAVAHSVSSLCVSSLGESFVLLDADDRVLMPPMLYTDPRGEEEARELSEQFGDRWLYLTTGVVPHAMYSVSKLLWIRKHAPSLFAKADKLLLVCDYIGYLLTGERVIDRGLAARSGMFDIRRGVFSEEMLRALRLSPSLFSTPKRAGSIVAPLKEELCEELGLAERPLLILGSHDQICAALGAGVLEEGEAVDGMGTVECITPLFRGTLTDLAMGKQGYPCVPYPVEGLYCTYMLNFSCSSTVGWLRKRIMHGYKGEEESYYDYIEKGVTRGPSGVLTLPYFGGAGTPYQDSHAKGAILNLRTDTADATLYQSMMEGTAMEMRLNAEILAAHGMPLHSLVATGGGSNSANWLQIKADIQNLPVKALRSHEGGLCGCAMLQALVLGTVSDLAEARERFVRYRGEYRPDPSLHAAYESDYQKYKKLYHILKEFN